MSTNAQQKHAPEQNGQNVIRLAGINHRSAPLELRERFAVLEEQQDSLLRQSLDRPEISEAVILSTCNRVEIVVSTPPDADRAFRESVDSLFEIHAGISRAKFSGSLYQFESDSAITHLFRVAAGLDSLVPGEPQVLGQLKRAYVSAKGQGATSALLNRLFHRAFGVAKAVRTNTKIGQNAVSVCYAAKELAEQIFGDLSQASVMLVGAGDTGALALKHFRSAGVKRFYVANKTLSRAGLLAETVGGAAIELSSIPTVLPQVDIIIGASGISQDAAPIIARAAVEQAIEARRGDPQFFIDLGVPRNFDSSIEDISDAFLYNVDDLQAVVERNLSSRESEFAAAELIVDEEVSRFLAWLKTRSADPSIREVQRQYAGYRDVEVARTLRRLKSSGFNEEQCRELEAALKDMGTALVRKTLHQPITTLKHSLSDAGALDEERAAARFRDYLLGSGEDFEES